MTHLDTERLRLHRGPQEGADQGEGAAGEMERGYMSEEFIENIVTRWRQQSLRTSSVAFQGSQMWPSLVGVLLLGSKKTV